MLRNFNQPKLCNVIGLSVKKKNISTNIIEAKILTGPFKVKDFLTAKCNDSNRYVISIKEIAIPNSIGICNHDQQSTGTIFRIVWLIFTH